MLYKLLVTSPSNRKFAKDIPLEFDTVLLIKEPMKTKPKIYPGLVVGLGGGSVIDCAKIMAGNNPCYAIPTTASGAACTSHAVIWGNKKKIDIKTKLPVLCELYRYLPIKISKRVEGETITDCTAHINESMFSVNSTPTSLLYGNLARIFLDKYIETKQIVYLIEAGNYAGKAIEITGTNFYHSLSYILTLQNGLSHGKALKVVLSRDKNWMWKSILKKAMRFNKIKQHHDFERLKKEYEAI